MTFIQDDKEVIMPFEEGTVARKLIVTDNPDIGRFNFVLPVNTISQGFRISVDFMGPMVT